MAILDAFKKKATVKKSAAPKKDLPAQAGKEVKSETSTPKVKKTSPKGKAPTKIGGLDVSMVLHEPRITEKATMLSERGAYVFDVHQGSTKDMVRQAIIAKYKVSPVKINIMNITKKRRQSRTTGIMHPTGGGRKAVVFLKKGEKIDFV